MRYLLLICGVLIHFTLYGQKQFISVDSTKIWVNTIGLDKRLAGQPVIIFESGLGTSMDNWDRILEGVAKLGPVVTYDRPGIGQSTPILELPTIKNVSARLIRLLNQLKLDPPYVLVGHSLGGLYVRGFAVYYPELLAGLVIIDPADFTENHENKRAYYEVLNWENSKVDSLIQTFIDKRKKRSAQAPSSIKREGQVLEVLRESEFKEVTEVNLPNIPIHILTGGRFDMPLRFRSKSYDDEALFRSKIKHRLLRWTDVIQSVDKGMLFYSGDAGHFVHYDDPELLISSIKIVLQDYQLLEQKKHKKK